jgi:hypothetical protein
MNICICFLNDVKEPEGGTPMTYLHSFIVVRQISLDRTIFFFVEVIYETPHIPNTILSHFFSLLPHYTPFRCQSGPSGAQVLRFMYRIRQPFKVLLSRSKKVGHVTLQMASLGSLKTEQEKTVACTV